MDFIFDTIHEIKNMSFRKILLQALNLGMIVGSALMIWKSLMVLTMSESPVVVVLTGSMEPAYFRGDILFLSNYDEVIFQINLFFLKKRIIPGDVVVYKLEGQEIPIVHRALTISPKDEDDFYLLTKGDNNNVDDRALYQSGKIWLNKKDLLGKIRGYCPYVGFVTIIMNDYPQLKWGLIGIMAILVIVAKDPQS